MGKDDLVGYLGLRGLLSIPISLEIDDAEVNNERVRATCYLLLAYLLLLCLLLLLLFPRRLLYISLIYSPSLPFSPPPLPYFFSFLFFFLGGGRGGEVGGGGKGGGSKPPPLSPRKGGVGDEVSPTPLLVLVLKNKKYKNIKYKIKKIKIIRCN